MIARLLWIAVALCVLGALPDAAPGAPSARGARGAAAAPARSAASMSR
jgi:hypothetical protein